MPYPARCCAGASITRDDARNHAIYGEDVLAADVIAGRVPPPSEVRGLRIATASQQHVTRCCAVAGSIVLHRQRLRLAAWLTVPEAHGQHVLTEALSMACNMSYGSEPAVDSSRLQSCGVPRMPPGPLVVCFFLAQQSSCVARQLDCPHIRDKLGGWTRLLRATGMRKTGGPCCNMRAA